MRTTGLSTKRPMISTRQSPLSSSSWGSVIFVPRQSVQNQCKQGASPVVHPQQQSSRTRNASILLQVTGCTDSLRYHRIQFDRMLTHKTQVDLAKLRRKKRLTVLKATTSKGIENVICSLLTYLCPSLPVEHRPSTTSRHRTLFWAALVIPDQLVPCCFSSASVSRLSSSSLAGSRSGLGVWCWMLAS